ncbi:MAG TPA: two-component regulator propeller domain-containing protein [Bacteroidales bacterium]|nr:two-component regulator propeller domain-containing protein [Bacteroidales bacterium]
MYRQLLFLLLIIVIPVQLFSQKILDFEKLSIDDGFTSSSANTIIQDEKGFIWIGTWNGLNKYDGYKVENFRPSYHDTTTLSNREISALMEDHLGNIWIGTTSGLNRLNPKTGRFTGYIFQQRIISLLEDNDHVIWVGTWNGGLFQLDPESGKLKHYLGNDIVSDIYEDSRNILWVATYYGLVNFDRSTGSYNRYLPDDRNPEQSISNSTVTQIVESKNGNLWVGTWGGGLNKLIVHPNKDSMQFVHYTKRQSIGSLSSNVIYRLFYDAYGNLWIGTWDSGLYLLEPSQKLKTPDKAIFHNFHHDLSDPYSLSGNNISALFVDRSGELWVGSSKIDRTNIIKTGVTRYKTSHFTNGVFTQNTVRSFSSSGNSLWVGTSNELKLFRLDKQNQFRLIRNISRPNYQNGNNQYLSNSIMSLLSCSDGLWVGTEDAGLLFYPGQAAYSATNPKFSVFNTQTHPALPGNKVCNLVRSEKYPGVIWIGTMQNGFAKLTRKNGKTSITNFVAGANEKSISDNNIRTIVEDHEGKVWIGTQNGLNCFDPEQETFKKFFYSLSDSGSINDNVINVLYEDAAGRLWIGTNQGLNKKIAVNRLTGSSKIRFKGYPHKQNLSDEIINNILEDSSGYLWIGLYRGMVKFNESSETINKEFFTREYQHVVIERNSAVRTGDGNFLLGGANGFISFYPDSLLKQARSPRVCITDLQVFNESIQKRNNEESSVHKSFSIPYVKEVHLTYKDKVITFVFSAMDFKDPQKNEYAYYLEGFDDQWNEVGDRNSATYTNIHPGSYIFKVKAANSDGVWNDTPATLKLTIAPPWWKTAVAYVFYGLIFLGLLYFFKQYSIIEAREKGQLMLEHMQNEKEHELNELKSQFFTNITHEFRTPLTLILGPAEELQKIRGLSKYAGKQAELIQRNAQRLLRLVNQLMEFRKVEKGKMEIYLQKTDIAGILNDLYESFKSMADSKQMQFELNLKQPAIVGMVDRDKFEKVLYNMVSNAFKYTEDGGKITVTAGLEEVEDGGINLVIEIEDTGIGISPEYSDKVFERFFQAHQQHTQSTGGIGLFLSRAFIELHNGNIELESEAGKGSCFTLTIPVDIRQYPVGYQEEEAFPDTRNRLENAPADEASRTSEISTESRLPRVLIVEDDGEMNDFIVSGLSGEFSVLATFNGREGLELARKIYPDIIITDIMMPEMDGIELCKQLRKDLVTSHIPVVFLSAKTMREDEITGLQMGAVDYIYKPFNMMALRLKIQNILENRKNLHERIRADRLMEPEKIELSSLDETFLKDAVDAVNHNLDDPGFDVEKFSHEIGISANQAYRKIKALTGQTAKEFIRNQRLKTSATLLMQKKRSISEIIYMVGFSSPSYFTRCFREYYGCTPKEFIDKNNKA